MLSVFYSLSSGSLSEMLQSMTMLSFRIVIQCYNITLQKTFKLRERSLFMTWGLRNCKGGIHFWTEKLGVIKI